MTSQKRTVSSADSFSRFRNHIGRCRFAVCALLLGVGGYSFAAPPTGEVAVHDAGPHTGLATWECTSGHKVESRQVSLDSGAVKYTFKYTGCQDPSHGEERPSSEGNFGMPEPSSANWYHTGFMNVMINGKNAVRYRVADLQVTEKGPRGGFQVLWAHPDADVGLRLLMLPGANHVMAQMAWKPRPQATIKTITLRLTCYPSFFTAARHRHGDRHCQTPRIDNHEPASLKLVPAEDTYLYYYDTVFDVAKGEGEGPCGLVFAPAGVESGKVGIGDYAVSTELVLKPEAGQVRFSLYDFAGRKNAEAEAYLKARAAEDLARLVATDFRPQPVATLDIDKVKAEAAELLSLAGDDAKPFRGKLDELFKQLTALKTAADAGDWKSEAGIAGLLAGSAETFWKLRALAVLNKKQDAGVTLHVAPNGNDAWSGRLTQPQGNDGPFATPERARDELRKLKKQRALADGAVVEIRGGVYELARPLTLEAEDSGLEGAPIIYRARPGEEVRLVGGVEVKQFQKVTDPMVLARLEPSARNHVLQASLTALGVKDLGTPTGNGNRLEVFFQDKPMTLSRWPNEGFVRIVDVTGGQPHKIHGIPGDKVGRFVYDGDRPTRWAQEKDVWLHGYWFWDWAEQRQQIESMDLVKRTIALVPPHHSYGYRKGQWYYAVNLLPELDKPGEWYVDRPSGMLYFWPPAPIDQGKTLVSVLPRLVEMKKVSHVTLRGLVLEACRATAVQIHDGQHIQIVGCTIRNAGSWAVEMSGKQSAVVGCDIYETGDGGIAITGGDRKTLTPAGLVADNNHIHDYSRWNRVYRAGVSLNGVGNRASHNLIDNAPHQAISFGGNDHVIEFNEIHSVCYESNDAGAIYSGRNWSTRGTVVRCNYFHHISGFEGRGCVGVYLDDQFSGTAIENNLFRQVTRAAMIGGGRDCTITNNVFIDCKPATHVDARGLGWAAGGRAGLEAGLKSMPYQESLWAGRYPSLIHILDEDPMAPRGNVISRNICVGGRWGDLEAKAKPLVTFHNNLIDQDPGFLDCEHGNFQLKDDSPAFSLGFQRLPIDKMGLYQDSSRASWPVVHTVRPMPVPVKK